MRNALPSSTFHRSDSGSWICMPSALKRRWKRRKLSALRVYVRCRCERRVDGYARPLKAAPDWRVTTVVRNRLHLITWLVARHTSRRPAGRPPDGSRDRQVPAAAAAMGSSGSKKLPKEDMDFLMENTNFTKQQIKAWYSGFMVSRCHYYYYAPPL